MQHFADIVLPVAVRQVFTYSIPDDSRETIAPGMRVWIPFRNQFNIGMVVRIHDNKPGFETRCIEKVLDSKPVFSQDLLDLTEWIHRFYYCGWGEVIQSALPVGLNFYSETYIRLNKRKPFTVLKNSEREIVEVIDKEEFYRYKDAKKRWQSKKYRSALLSLLKRGYLEKWEKPELRMQPMTVKTWRWAAGIDKHVLKRKIESFSEKEREFKWVQALEHLSDLKLPQRHSRLMRNDLLNYYTLHRIEEEGLIKKVEVEKESYDTVQPEDLEYNPSLLNELNMEQNEAYNAILKKLVLKRYASFLLYGITGSGKTEVYIHALKKVIEEGKDGIILVPEIGLTPQIIKRFYRIFGSQIAVIHSRLSDRDRYLAWKAIHKGDKRIVIGTRSAIFAPVQNLGLIVVDEEYDMSYKQEDPAPRYHARDVAIMRAKHDGAVVVMGSATPSLRALQGVRRGKYELITLSDRPFNAKLPEVKVLDLKQYRSAMRGPLAIPLYNAVDQAIKKNDQVILLHNRRGYSSYLQCQNCGYIPECPNCSVSLTFHKPVNQLRCHYCGFTQKTMTACTSCGELEITPTGTGTQKLEEQLGELFGDSCILRMDYDTTSGKDSHRKILEKFENKEANILIGTQIVGKGLDFPDVTVVGVINADTELAFPSFRSSERLFQLLSQLAGRSGRSLKEGKVYFQTWQPNHKAIKAARKHDYRSFAKSELAYRKSLRYPPFSRLIRFTFKGNNERKVQLAAEKFTGVVIDIVGMEPVLGPAPSIISRMQKFYYWECQVKINPDNGAKSIEKLLDSFFDRYAENKPKGIGSVRINVNVDALE